MKPQCRNCSQFVPQMFDGQTQPIGRCIHISFLKAGFGKPNEMAGGVPEVRHERMHERQTPEETAKQFADGYFYHDHIDIKLARGRVCDHWKSPLALAQDTLSHHGFSMDYVRSFPDLHPTLAKYIDDGLPTVTEHRGKLNEKLGHWEYDVTDAPAEVIAGYESCYSCRNFQQTINPDGSPQPFIGACTKNSSSEAGVLSAFDEGSENPTVFAFMGCMQHKPASSYNVKDEITPIPPRLTLFVETNPIDLTVAQIDSMYKFPTVTRNRSVEKERYDELMDTDLTKTLRKRHNEIDFNSFYADMALGPVNDFFSKGLRAGTLASRKHWANLQYYKTADDDLFGPAPTATEEEALEAEFGSTLASQS